MGVQGAAGGAVMGNYGDDCLFWAARDARPAYAEVVKEVLDTSGLERGEAVMLGDAQRVPGTMV